MTPTLDTALLISSRAGADLGPTLDRLESDAFFRWEEEVGADETAKLPGILQFELQQSLSASEWLIHDT